MLKPHKATDILVCSIHRATHKHIQLKHDRTRWSFTSCTVESWRMDFVQFINALFSRALYLSLSLSLRLPHAICALRLRWFFLKNRWIYRTANGFTATFRVSCTSHLLLPSCEMTIWHVIELAHPLRQMHSLPLTLCARYHWPTVLHFLHWFTHAVLHFTLIELTMNCCAWKRQRSQRFGWSRLSATFAEAVLHSTSILTLYAHAHLGPRFELMYKFILTHTYTRAHSISLDSVLCERTSARTFYGKSQTIFHHPITVFHSLESKNRFNVRVCVWWLFNDREKATTHRWLVVHQWVPWHISKPKNFRMNNKEHESQSGWTIYNILCSPAFSSSSFCFRLSA